MDFCFLSDLVLSSFFYITIGMTYKIKQDGLLVYFECNISFALLQLFSTEKYKMRVFMMLELKKEKIQSKKILAFTD